MIKNGMRPIHPGEILREEYLTPLGLSANALARAGGNACSHQRGRTREAWHHRRHGLRLARYFGTDAQSWLNLQAAYDLWIAEIEAGKTIQREVKPRAA